MKNAIHLTLFALLMIILGVGISMYLQHLAYQHDNQINKYRTSPMNKLVGDDDDDDGDTRPKLREKNRDRSPLESKQINQDLLLLKNGRKLSSSQYGQWHSIGPDNQPGCWEMTEFDERDNTVWAMTCGHYGATQSIFKGSLAGDDFRLISGQLPYRFNSMILTHSDSHKQRLLVAINNGQIKYTDNGGISWESSQGLLDNITQLIVNRQTDTGEWKLYATYDQRVYVSTDDGNHFSVLEDFASKQKMSLYSPRYDNQPGNSNVAQSQQSVIQHITVTNSGTVDEQLGHIVGISSPISTDFAQQCASKILAVGNSCTFTISINTDNVTSGSQIATVNIADGSTSSRFSINYQVTANTCQDPNAKQYPDYGNTMQDHYSAGDVVNYHGYVWQAHYWVSKNIVPSTPDSGWKLFETPANIIFKWDENTVYNSSDVVAYNSAKYQAKWWTRGNQPSSSPYGPWKDQGTVTGIVCDRPS
ncbi:MAG: hypothetical protein O2809_07345 [Proteobacteria bacterium]|nr:hypothetical protein [Pseudomonadota bacterium]